MATSRLVTSSTNATGAQIIRSPALGVIRLSTRLTAVKATTNHTSHGRCAGPPGQCHTSAREDDSSQENQHCGLNNGQDAKCRRELPRKRTTHGVRSPGRAERQRDLKRNDDGRENPVHYGGTTLDVQTRPPLFSMQLLGSLIDSRLIGISRLTLRRSRHNAKPAPPGISGKFCLRRHLLKG